MREMKKIYWVRKFEEEKKITIFSLVPVVDDIWEKKKYICTIIQNEIYIRHYGK